MSLTLIVYQICEGIPVVSAWQSTGYAAEALYRWASCDRTYYVYVQWDLKTS